MKTKKNKQTFVNNISMDKDILSDRFCNPNALSKAREILKDENISEEAFLGAQGVLMINGLL